MSSESERAKGRPTAQIGLAIVLFGYTLSCAATGDPAPSSALERAGAPAIAGSPSALLRTMTNYLSAQESFSFHVETNFETFERGQTLQFAGAADIAIRRPDGMAIDYRDDLSARRVYYDGSQLILVDPLERLYASAEAPPDLDDALDYFEVVYGLVMPLTDLIGADAYSLITSRALESRYVGLHDVDGEACHHLAYLGESADLQLWIRDGDSPVPCKLVVDYKEKPGRPAYIAVMMDWEFGQRFSDSRFAPTVPDGARRIEFLDVEEARR